MGHGPVFELRFGQMQLGGFKKELEIGLRTI